MIVGVHALVGAALSWLCRTRTQAFALGFASHLVADALPHRDLEVPVEAALLGGALALVTAFAGSESRELAGAIGAAVPDLENLAGRLLDLPEERLLLPIHRDRHGRETQGFIGQLVLAGLAAAVVAWKGKPTQCR